MFPQYGKKYIFFVKVENLVTFGNFFNEFAIGCETSRLYILLEKKII